MCGHFPGVPPWHSLDSCSWSPLWRSPFRWMGADVLSGCPLHSGAIFTTLGRFLFLMLYFGLGSKWFHFHGKQCFFGPPSPLTALFLAYRKEKKNAALSLFCHLIIASPWQIFEWKLCFFWKSFKKIQKIGILYPLWDLIHLVRL